MSAAEVTVEVTVVTPEVSRTVRREYDADDSLYVDKRLGLLFTVVSAGLTTGALVWGVLVDMIGKK